MPNPYPQSMFGNMMPQNMFGFDPSNINTGLIMGGLGMLTGQNPQQQFQQGMQGYITGSAMDQDRRDRKSEEERKRLWNEAVAKYGQGKFSPEETALMGLNPDLAQSVIANRMTPSGGSMPSDIQEFIYSQQNPEFMEYQIKMREAGRPSTTVNMNDWKVPPGYKLKDENNPDAGVEPIAGGPAEQIPSELAARVGMADSFLQQAPDLKQRILGGGVTGPLDRAQAGWNSSSDQAQIYRQLQSGADALQRMLTGAGMNIAEAQQYAQRYLPSYTDSAQSAAQKLDQLVIELQRVKEMTMRGRGGTQDAEGWLDLGNGIRLREIP